MRQAGRYLPAFRELKEANNTLDFFGICRSPELCCKLTLQPLTRYSKLDAAIIFSDILVIPQALGFKVVMEPGKGPTFPSPLQKPTEQTNVENLFKDMNINETIKRELKYVYDAITLTRTALDLEFHVPLIGFSGAPWTLMAYMVEGEGTKTFSKAKTWLFLYPKDSHKLLEIITTAIIQHLKCQIEAGAQALQVFDSWSGELGPDTFKEFCLPYLKRIANEVKEAHPTIPLILFAKGSDYALESLAELNYNVLGIDWTIEPQRARELVSKRKDGKKK